LLWTRRRLLTSGFAATVAPGLARGEGMAELPSWGQPSDPDLHAGHAALTQQVAHHGGRAAWDRLPCLTCRLDTAWAPAARMWRPPMPKSTAPRLTLDFRRDKARLDFHDPAGTAWGHDSVGAWAARQGQRTYDSIHHIARALPVLKWYAAMPHKLLDPGVSHRILSTAPDRVLVKFGTHNGQTGDRMLATFASGRLATLHHTARAFGDNVAAVARFESWSELEGVALPTSVRVSLTSPTAIQDAQVVRYLDWQVAKPVPGFFEKPDAPR